MLSLEGYTLSQIAHEGPQTILYRGIRGTDHVPVVLKLPQSDCPSADENARIAYEYNLTKDLKLPGVVRHFGLETHGQRVVLVMEDLGSESLHDIIRSRPVDVKSALRIAASVAKILQSLHNHHILHKDIKPSNILVDPQTQQVTLIDFGVATRLSEETPVKGSNMLEGTLAYMSPEQTGRMNRAVDLRTDIYSLGVTLYELLTGVLPFQTTDPADLVYCLIARMPTPPDELVAGLPKVVSDIVMKLLSKAAEDRYQCARGLAADLEECLRQLESTDQVAPFPLGRHDRTNELHIPQKLYGREPELTKLLHAFTRASDGAVELFLVSGSGGVGKSVLVKEIQKDLVQQRGYFIEGKFDESNRNIPYAPILHAFRALIKQILTEPPERLALWQQDLQNAIATYGPVLVDLIPELEAVIGPQPGLSEVGATEAQNRFMFGFQAFLHVFAAADHPLLIFLDDLQWADSASLKLLNQLLSDPVSGYLLVIGAYRENEMDAAHPLWSVIADIRKAGKDVHEIAVEPLALADVCQLIADTLGMGTNAVQPLAELVFAKTLGNPFFLNQFLRMLHEQHLLFLDEDSGVFRWDLQRIQEAEVTDNVITLMVSKLRQLAPGTQRVLMLAACIGHRFDLITLSLIHEKSWAETAMELWEALEKGFVRPLNAEYRFLHASGNASRTDDSRDPPFNISYKFLHDRVRQAVYSLIAEGDNREVHLRIGTLMLAQSEDPTHDERLLDITNHLNIGVEFITDVGEKFKLGRLNLAAGKKVKASTAYEAAASYFQIGVKALPAGSWEREHALTYSLHVELAECEYLTGHFDRAEALVDVLVPRTKSFPERAHIENLRIFRFYALYQFADALEAGLAALSLFGINLPDGDDARQAAAEAELAAVRENLANRNIQDLLDTPPMSDPDTDAAVRLLVNLIFATYMASPSLRIFTAAKQVNLALRYGHTSLSAYGYMNYGFILAVVMGRYEEAYEFGKLAISLNEKWNNAELVCKLNLLFFCAISFYRRPLRECIPYFRQGYEAGLASGDFVQLCYTCQHGIAIRIGLGDGLSSIADEVERLITLVRRINDANIVACLTVMKQVIANLRGTTNNRRTLSDSTIDETQLVAEMENAQYEFTRCWYHIFKLQILFLHGDYAGALSMAHEAEKRLMFTMGMFVTTELPFYTCLTLTALYPTATAEEQEKYIPMLEAQKAKLMNWAENCRENFQHKYLLVEAELARIQGDEAKAADFYESAVESAQENGFLHQEALASELAAKFYLEKSKKRKDARLYMTDAYNGYLRWGAIAKAEDIAGKYAHLLVQSVPATLPSTTSTTKRVLAELLDMKTLLQAAQAIASELVFENVLDRWMKIVIENAGAQKGALILHRDNKLWIEAAITVDPDTIRLGLALPIEQSNDIALAVVQYVARTREPVILNDPSRDTRFAADPYIIAERPKSILCLAMTHQGRLIGILYLENNTAYEAFTSARLELLGLLASQAAIAVDNALLYAHVQSVTDELKRANETLEHQVEHRTNELRRTTEELQQANERLQLELAERARSEQAHVALQEKIIRVQTERLAELASPLIPISEQIMVMPLVGTMDEQRAQQVLETALDGVQTNQTRVVIIDITGVKRVDAGVAGTLVKMAQGLRLLGAQVMLTGIGPAVATTFVELGIDLQSIITRSTLQSAIAYAMGQMSRPLAASSTARRGRGLS